MIAYDKHICTIHLLCIAEIDFNEKILYQCAIKSEITSSMS